jgi:hypothetical protein
MVEHGLAMVEQVSMRIGASDSGIAMHQGASVFVSLVALALVTTTMAIIMGAVVFATIGTKGWSTTSGSTRSMIVTIHVAVQCDLGTPSVKSVASQAPTTYTAVRGCATPRFLPLPPHAHG